MRRRVFTILSVISLLLCVASAGLWLRSYWVVDSVYYSIGDNGRGGVWRTLSLTSARGQIGLHAVRWGIEDISPSPGWYYSVYHIESPSSVEQPDVAFIGFELWYSHGVPTGGYNYTLDVPNWFFCVAFAATPTLWLRTRRKHVDAGACRICGYDLRATPDRCPECAGVPATSSVE